MKRSVYKTDHSSIVDTLNNMAYVYYIGGNYAVSLTLYAERLDMMKRLFGPQHPSVAVSVNNIAILYDKQCKYTEALAMYTESLEFKRALW